MCNKEDPFPMLTPHKLGFEVQKRKEESEDQEEEPQEEPEDVEIDPFIEEIEKVRRVESPAVRDTIDRAKCFGYGWYVDPQEITDEDDDDGGFCTEVDCDLFKSNLCEMIWTRATRGQQIEREEQQEEISTTLKKSKKKKEKYRDGMYEKYPYVDRGYPVDKLASEIWQMVGCPPEIPGLWLHASFRNKLQRQIAKETFVRKYGDGLLVSRRRNYHVYILDGASVFRFWVRHPGGGWLDMCKEISQLVLKLDDKELELKTPRQTSISTKSRYRWFPGTVWVSRKRHLKRVRIIFEKFGIYVDMEQEIGGKEDE